MRYDIKAMIQSCDACQTLQPSKPLEPFIATIAKFPMEQISLDLFHVGNKTYIVVADRFSGYIWAHQLRDQSTKAVTGILDGIFIIFGVPLICRTDGGPQFRAPFKNYCAKRGITHETSSPYNPRSNGHAEAAVKAAKYLLLKTKAEDFPSALAAWRNTARDGKPSPNEMFFGRKIRDEKAMVTTTLLPMQIPDAQQQHPADCATHSSAPSDKEFRIGDHVRVQNQATLRWDTKAEITGVSTSGRTLDLVTDDGVAIRRNRRFVRAKCATQSS